MPDENSNLNLPSTPRRPNNRRRGRRGGRGRGRGPRPPAGSADATPPGNPQEEAHDAVDAAEVQPGSQAFEPGADAAPPPVESGPAAGPTPPETPSPVPAPQERAQAQQPARAWVKPADFRPAETSAIHQAVLHATEIAENLRELVERIDEILELVEVAERQKLADERELDNLRRALRRIQPPRQSHGHDNPRGSHRGESRHGRGAPPPPREDPQHHAEEMPEVPPNARAEAEASQEPDGVEDSHMPPSSPVGDENNGGGSENT